jgi:hypothetical protein
MILLDLLRRPPFVWLIFFESGDDRPVPPSTSGGKEMVRGISREDSLAVLAARKDGKRGWHSMYREQKIGR